MNIDDIINEFYKLHDYKGKFRFNTPEYVSFHRSLTDFIYENHLEDTMYWKRISDNLLYKATEYMTIPEAGIISENLELLRRHVLQARNEPFWKYIHPLLLPIIQPKFLAQQYADCVESAFKEINSRLKKLYRKFRNKELDGNNLMNNVFSPNNPVLTFENIETQTGKDVQIGYMNIFAGAMTGIRNPKAHENQIISKDMAIKRLIFASLLMDKIDEAISYSNIEE